MLQYLRRIQNCYLESIKFLEVSRTCLELISHKKEFYVICERLKNNFFPGLKTLLTEFN